MELIIGIVVGGIVSLFIAHLYYKKSSKEQKEVFSKLPNEVKKIILESSAKKLSIKELNQLLEEKVYDKDPGGDPLPFKACPKCGSEKLKKSAAIDYDQDEEYFSIKCEDCGWSEW